MDANYKPYKRYDDEFKRNAVELLESSGRPISVKSRDSQNFSLARGGCGGYGVFAWPELRELWCRDFPVM